MRTIHRIEIVVDATHSRRVTDLLAAQGLQGWTMIRGVSGSGERGWQPSDEITGVSNNNYILTTCAPEELEALTQAIRPLLGRIGGVCIVSEARWLEH